jgi:hypothetical protein
MYILKLRFLFAIGFGFIIFFNISFAGDDYSIRQKENSGIENIDNAGKGDKETLSEQYQIKKLSWRYLNRYHPAHSVYYEISRGLFYYLADNNWRLNAYLFSDLEKRLGDSVKIEMDSETPSIDSDTKLSKTKISAIFINPDAQFLLYLSFIVLVGFRRSRFNRK